MTCCGQHPDEHVDRDAVGVAIGNAGHSGSRSSGEPGDFGMGEPSCLNDLGQREGKLGAKFHFGRIGLRQPQGTPKLVSGPNRHGLSGLHDDSMS